MAWMEAYMRMRMADIGDHPNLDKGADSDNQFFRSERLRENPITDWYKTLRTSKFEQDVFEKQGFKFVSVRDSNGRIRPGKIIMNDKTLATFDNISAADWDGIGRGDVASIRKYNDLVDLQKFDNDGQARKAIRKAVNDELHFTQMIKRRHVRKDIQNMTGVRDWRFFEKTMTKAQEKKIDIRNKLIDKAVPDSTKSGKFIKCLFGISECTFSEDPSNPDNKADGSIKGSSVVDNNGQSVPDADPSKPPTTVDLGPASDLIKDLFNKIATIFDGLNVISLMDSLKRVNDAILSHKLSKGVAIARGVQAMSLYQVAETARDQTKSGELTGAEYGKFNEIFNSTASSDGWTKVIQGQGDPSKLTNSEGSKFYCSQKAQSALEKDPSIANTDKRYSYAYLCPDKQVGGSNTATNLEKGYTQTVGAALGPILSVYSGARNAPIIGPLISWVNNAIAKITSKVQEAVIAAFGLGDNIQDVSKWLATHVASFLGAGPILTGNEPGGVFANWLVQGGAYTAEASARAAGGALTTAATRVTATQTLAQYQTNQNDQMSTFDKYLSLSNVDSVAAKQAFALSQLNSSSILNKLSNFGSIFKTIGSAFTAPFSRQASAASSIKGYEGTELAGILTYDLPKECQTLDPLTSLPSDATNIQQILGADKVPTADLTWDLVDDGDAWYKYVYDKIGDVKDPDSKSLKIYNCHLNDTKIRGGIGAKYGYIKDGGLDDSATSAASPANPTTPAGATIDIAHMFDDSTSIDCAPNTKDLGTQDGYHAGTKVKIRICAVSNLPGTGEESNGNYGVSGADGKAVVNSRASGAVYAMAEAAKQAGVTLGANSAFRTMAHQQALCPCDGVHVAVPGTSNHQMGLAIDFATLPSTSGPVTGNKVWGWLSANADKFSYKNYPAEAWHWSPDGH
jgi:hypothetical protein